MPSCPIEIPSETEIVPNSIGKPSAPRTPTLARLASLASDRLHGVISFQDEAMPTCGLRQSSSPMPTARSIPRAAARSRPSVTMCECGLRCAGLPDALSVVTAESLNLGCGHDGDPADGAQASRFG